MSSNDSNETGNRIRRLQELQKEASIVRKIVLSVVLVLGILLLGGGIGGFFYLQSAMEPIDPTSEKTVNVTIPIGSSTRAIANILEENDIIKDARVFRYYIKFRNETGFQAGDYEFSPSMTIDEILAKLKTGKVMKDAVFKVTIPEGRHMEEIASILSKKTDYSEEEIMNKLNDQAYIQNLIELYPSVLSDELLDQTIRYPLEGYLFPATYEFYEETPSLEKIIEKMISKTESVLAPYQNTISEGAYSVHEILTMASLIEEEATELADRETISSVFYNRLELGMPLQTDPTVLYSLGKHSVQITYEDLEVKSAYNTYQNNGLTPGPIASPGETSIQAALSPSETDYLYFYARPNGEVLFTRTLDEHNNVKNQYKHEWDQYKEQD
ncbi:endolytic transglycosylase MltG [Bacillus solimangrovi]|uniref:Endolytic murein transglycosylase n=1 Tax=Bacillus solimangrovi TaxID=1305675 RepID=A0A1E5LBZ7_9BACI|nr:endolytic transglycosylase MltG [Bacillus solimangrovi]OEH91519.1 hypothetical protein BFG57_05235 [Bacillus solimangrovi]